jgi:hypothetical protein
MGRTNTTESIFTTCNTFSFVLVMDFWVIDMD